MVTESEIFNLNVRNSFSDESPTNQTNDIYNIPSLPQKNNNSTLMDENIVDFMDEDIDYDDIYNNM